MSPRIRNNKRRERGEVTIGIRGSGGVDDADRRDGGICVYGKSSGHVSEGGGRVNILGINIYPVPPVESLKVERQNALYVSAGMNVLKFPKGKP